MPPLTLYLTTQPETITGQDIGPPQETLWHKRMDTPWLPDAGDLVELTPDGLDIEVRRRYWNADGTVNAYLLTIVIDPAPATRALMHVGSAWFEQHTAWYTERDGNLAAQLQAGGWAEWHT
jgi:hypothetical protein